MGGVSCWVVVVLVQACLTCGDPQGTHLWDPHLSSPPPKQDELQHGRAALHLSVGCPTQQAGKVVQIPLPPAHACCVGV